MNPTAPWLHFASYTHTALRARKGRPAISAPAAGTNSSTANHTWPRHWEAAKKPPPERGAYYPGHLNKLCLTHLAPHSQALSTLGQSKALDQVWLAAEHIRKVTHTEVRPPTCLTVSTQTNKQKASCIHKTGLCYVA